MSEKSPEVLLPVDFDKPSGMVVVPEALVQAVKELDAAEDYQGGGDAKCFYCGEYLNWYDSDGNRKSNIENHTLDCPWRKLKELVG